MTPDHTQVRHMIRRRVGVSAAITGRELADAIGVNPRGSTVRDIIHDLRMRGEVICSNSRGYYAPADNDDVRDTLEILNHRIAKIAQARDALALAAL